MKKVAVALVFLFVACGTALFAGSTATTANPQTHTVRRGQYLQYIATRHKVGWEAMLLVNEKFLQTKYQEVCGELSGKFRRRHGDRGAQKGGLFYCNDRFSRPYGNTLQPGWKLAIPSAEAPKSISQSIAEISGNRIALVIDDTGSMNDDRQRVGEFYLAAIRHYGKHLAGVWLYADGQVRKYEAGGVRFQTSGVLENTYGALVEAAKAKPDAIVLITDEQGDDWKWGEVQKLPPVLSHCIPDRGRSACEANLKRLASETRGRYISGVSTQ